MDNSSRRCGVAVIVPVFNRPTILVETLSVVMAQSLLPDELIVVDDGSTDDTALRAEEWLSAHADEVCWSVFKMPKAGAAKARNFGFSRMGDMDYVVFLDSDDHWPIDFLERCVQLLESNPNAVAATTERRYRLLLDEPTQSSGGLEMVSAPIPWMFRHGAGITSCSLLRSSVVREVGAWPQKAMCEDTELFCLLSLHGKWVFAEGAPVVFNLGSAAERNEECNLSRKYADRETLWARRLEEIYQKLAALDPSIELASLKASLSCRWYRAGKYHRKVHERAVARNCFLRAIRWQPLNVKYWRRWLQLKLR